MLLVEQFIICFWLFAERVIWIAMIMHQYEMKDSAFYNRKMFKSRKVAIAGLLIPGVPTLIWLWRFISQLYSAIITIEE